MLKRSISIILCLAMLLTMLPVNALAMEEIIPTEAVEAAVETEAAEEVEAEESAEQTEGAEETQETEAAEPEAIYEDDDEAWATESDCTDCDVTASPYLQQLPENILGCTNLYDCLAPVKGYYTATKYDTSNGAVLSVVMPVEPGDRIAASSFASVSENMGSVNGIRVTYLMGDEIVISLSPGEVYSGYTKDGYITVPDGVDTVCVPWWKPSDSNWLTLSQISRDFAVHSPRTVPEQAPTCTEIGYTAGEICEICNASLGEREEIPPTGHTYSGDTCTVCGTINLLTILDGKYVSILGDSISTFNGYSNDATVNTTIGGNGPRYDAGTADTKPGSYCLLETVDHTWWMHFAGRSGMKLLVNNSWAGSQVFGGKTSDGRVIPAAYLDRCVNLHDNTLENNPANAPINPDVIFVYLGINDYNFNRSKVGTGAVDYAGLVNSDGTCASPETFGEAYGIMLRKMQKAYPDAEIFAMTLLPENLYSVDKSAWEQHNAYIRAAAEYYDIPVVDLAENCAITWENYSGYMIDRIHPTTAGMELISDCIEAELVSYYEENPQHTHSYESAVTVPTCTGKGYTTYTCTCGDSYVAEYVDATGHKRINGICSVCGDSFAGKKASILSHSMSTYAGVSNSTASNSTIGKNDVYYTEGRHDVYREDTWWQQTIDALGMELLVNNSWSGSCVFMPRKGEASVGYGDRAVNLHNDHTGEEPDVIFVYLGCNDFAYYKDTFGKAADVDYAALIRADGTYGIPQTTCEAYAIMLHKAATRYPDAEIYCITSTARRETDYTGDSYPDAGQPTLYTAELQKVAKYFRYPVVDLENAIPKEVEIFDKYIGDKRAHANKLGMDQITNEVLSVMLGKDTEIRHVICEDGTVQEQAVLLGGSYQAEMTLAQGYSVVVTMGGKDVTAEVCQNGRITIAEVTGDIHVETVFERDPQSFRWEFRDGTLTSAGSSENVVTKLSGTVADNILNDGIFQMNTPVVLKHDLPWAVEWKCAEDWRGAMLVSQKESATKGMTYLTRSKGGQLCFGTYTGSQYDNYGIDISDLNSETHSYRLENRIAEDGSNMVWLYLDGVELGPMNSYFIGSKDQSKTSNWVSGRDFVFSFIGMTGHALRNCQLDYLSVTECDHTYENGICTGCGEEASFESMTMRYDDHLDITGKTVEIIEAGENDVIKLDGSYLIASGIGTAKVRIDGQLYEVTVEKAKINLITIMGQSNAGNHFANATSDVTCPVGTAYWWGNGKGTAAEEPVDYTQPSMGFHTPLLAELYAQSVAAGDPVKNVLIWQEGITSKNGQSITKWAVSATDTSGTDATVTMIENCRSYYEKNSDKYEIVGSGVYWLQGESDTAMDPELYIQRFMAMWGRLEQAGVDYLAFLRLRWGVNGNEEDRRDLHYSTSLSAQIQMINDNSNFYMATDLTENWVGTETVAHTVDISRYITVMETYGSDSVYTDAYGNDATYADGKLTTTMKSLYGSNNKCHYGKFGYGLIGADAAYNMYHALNGQDVSLVMTDTSGYAQQKKILANGENVTLDITDLTEDLSFRPECGSVGGILKLIVRSDGEDVTSRDGLLIKSGSHFGAISTSALRMIDNASVEIAYTTEQGDCYTVVCVITHEKAVSQSDYIWDFEEDLNARGANGEILNSLLPEAINGSYSIEDGYLKANGLQLQLEKVINLHAGKNWDIEWKYGDFYGGTAGFLLCEAPSNTIGNRGIYHVGSGQLMLSDYVDKKGYRNYTDTDVIIAENDCLRLSNRYVPDTGKNTISLWQNGVLVIEDYQLKGSLNGADDNLDMTIYPLSSEFNFRYLGNGGKSNWYVNCELDYLKVSFGDETELPAASMKMQYDDHVDISGRTLEIVDAGSPTSWQVGYGVGENTVADAAVVTVEGDHLVATGIGTARVRIDGILYEITVEAAPISLLLLIGQSNMQGIDGNPSESIVCPTGQVYATYADRYKKTVEDVTKFVPSALTGAYSTVNVTGDTTCLEDYPVNMLTEAGNGREGMDSGIAYEWVKQTGEKVWTVNVGYGGSSIKEWQKDGVHYNACLELFSACQETLRQEITAGHYTFSHMAYFWCQGCADENQTAKWYVDQFQTMHEILKNSMAFSAEKTFEFAGIIPIRSGHNWVSSYRAGVYKDTTNVPYYQSFKDLQFNGPRVAQYWMGNNPELKDIWNVCTIQEDWAIMPDGSDGVADYFKSSYADGIVNYTTQVKQTANWYRPTTPAAVHDNIHYNQIGYNEIGRESARNALILLGETAEPKALPVVEFLTWDGFTPVDAITSSLVGNSGTLVVPMVSPVWKSKEITYSVTNGLCYEYYDLLTDSVYGEGILSCVGADGSVFVEPRTLTTYQWRFDGNNLINDTVNGGNENALIKLAGSVTGDIYNGIRYQINDGVQLLHNEEWCVEIRLGNWTGNSGSMILSSSSAAEVNAPYFYFRPKDSFVGIGCYNGSTYDNYGISLKKHNIACAEEEHNYRFINRIFDDGSNMVYLIVDDQEIGALMDHYVNSNLTDSGNDWINGRDFVMPYIGTTFAPISNCTIQSITVTETGYDPDIHLHHWSDWEVVIQPGPDGPGQKKHICEECGESEFQEVKGVWQTHYLNEHLAKLPENLCSAVDLWKVLEHDSYYYHSGIQWSKHESGRVYSVTLPIQEGDKIFATSFGKYGQNGNSIGTGNGIRVTFFDAEGVLKTLAPQDTYSEFSENGGYIVAPKGVVAVNVPMYSNGDDNELYILNREHCYGSWSVTSCPTPQKSGEAVRICKGCGSSDFCELEYAENRIYLEEKTDIVWIDGAEYAVQNGEVCYVDLPDGNAKTMVIHTYGEKGGKEYPVGMKVWTLENDDGFYTATRLEEFDDILQYAGSSIRVTGKKGIRMITAIDQEKKKDLTSDGLAGYTLKEYGTVIAWVSQINADKPLVLGKPYVKSNYAYKQGEADPIFAYKDGKMQYTNVLVNFSDEQCKKDIAMRPYMILTDGENDITLYGGIVERSIGYIAAQNAYTFDSEKPEEKDAHDYIWNIILYVYGEDFVPEKA